MTALRHHPQFALPELPPEAVLFGCSAAVARLRERIKRVAPSQVPVLIQGESGTGKDVIAQLIHAQSAVAPGALVKVNCPAIPGSLMESELFGHEKGSFTGAISTKPGRVEMAHGGTLFLDEISEIEMPLQAKLLQFLQDGRFTRIGAIEESVVDARILCATNRQLEQEVECGTFRRDLLYRIGVVTLRIPALRERMEDFEPLVAYFLELYNRRFNAQAAPFSAPVMASLRNYAWPGNIRELENLIQRYVVLGDEESILASLTQAEPDFPLQHLPLDGSVPLKIVTQRAVKEIERKVILRVLQLNRWNRKQTAIVLDISYRALLYKIHDLNVPSRSRRRFRKEEVQEVGSMGVALAEVQS